MAGNLSCDGSLLKVDSVAAEMFAITLALALFSCIFIIFAYHLFRSNPLFLMYFHHMHIVHRCCPCSFLAYFHAHHHLCATSSWPVQMCYSLSHVFPFILLLYCLLCTFTSPGLHAAPLDKSLQKGGVHAIAPCKDCGPTADLTALGEGGDQVSNEKNIYFSKDFVSSLSFAFPDSQSLKE